ncbi:hypothetical protein Taro_042677 [Colocasia esculenta]|uniref:Uncharacterized protein n=1 Tax=Colocasia esculenta TaxID=4460 RepID=A0A843WJ05_COLES|nr:hypothetical protein [Colocasia esculenta]
MIRAHAAGCSCCCAACVASVVAPCVRAVAARSEVSPRTVLCSFLVVVALPLRLRRIAWLPCVLVRFPRTVCGCPSESFSQDCSVLVSAVAVLPQSLRCDVGSASAFWRVFSERCLGGFVGGSPRTCLRCLCSYACYSRRPPISSGDKTSFQGRKTFVSHSEIMFAVDDHPVSKVFL